MKDLPKSLIGCGSLALVKNCLHGVNTTRRVPIVNLGKTGLKVSKLGFGTHDFGVASLKIGPEEGGRILTEAYKLGVRFWDTSDDYGSHPHVASALESVPRREVVISTKTSAKSGKGAKKTLEDSLEELGTEYVDVFLLHNVTSDWITGCRRVLRELNDVKRVGAAKAIGLSTHSVAVVREASLLDEVDVIMTICCRADQTTINRFHENIPLEDGNIEEMLHAIGSAHNKGKGTIAMKVLGTSAPPLVGNYRSSITWVAGLTSVDAMVVGMRRVNEVEKNVRALLSD